MMFINSNHLLIDESLLGDVNTIEELPEILVMDVGELMDFGASQGDRIPVIALDPNLFIGGETQANVRYGKCHKSFQFQR